MDLERVVADLLQKVERRFYGKYRGFVVDNDDPKHLGRLRVRVPSLLGSDVVTGWAMPCVPYGGAANQGILFIPEADSGVWIEFEEGDLEFPIWVGAFWSEPGGESELPKPNDPDGAEQSSVQDPVTRKIIKTRKGHTIQFEDADGDESILIVQVTDSGPNVVVLNADGISLTDLHGNSLVMASNGITLTDLTGNSVEMTDSAFTLTSKRPFTINAEGQAVELKAGAINFVKG
jgi:uncharacterized protein involved in type VI secretion and phage assembly